MNVYRVRNTSGFAEIIVAMNIELAIAKFREDFKDDTVGSVELVYQAVTMAGAKHE